MNKYDPSLDCDIGRIDSNDGTANEKSDSTRIADMPDALESYGVTPTKNARYGILPVSPKS